MAVPLSLTTVWWVGLAMVGVLVLFYLIAAYAPWLFYLAAATRLASQPGSLGLSGEAARVCATPSRESASCAEGARGARSSSTPVV